VQSFVAWLVACEESRKKAQDDGRTQAERPEAQGNKSAKKGKSTPGKEKEKEKDRESTPPSSKSRDSRRASRGVKYDEEQEKEEDEVIFSNMWGHLTNRCVM